MKNKKLSRIATLSLAVALLLMMFVGLYQIPTVSAAPSIQGWIREGKTLSQQSWFTAVAAEAVVLYNETDGQWKMWFRGATPGEALVAIGYATSTDGFNWTPYENPILGNSSYKLTYPSVYWNGTYFNMYANNGTYWQYIQHFVSLDGIDWTWVAQMNRPLTEDWADGYVACHDTWQLENGTWAMLYELHSDTITNWSGGIALSDNGVDWTPSSCNPIGVEMTTPKHYTYDGEYYLWYGNRTAPRGIYYATSSDLATWTPHSDNPVILAETYQTLGLAYPYLVTNTGNGTFLYCHDDNDYAVFRYWSPLSIPELLLREEVTTSEVTTSASDGYIMFASSFYTTAHNAPVGTVYNTGTGINIGQVISGVPPYYIYRGYLFFDTSTIPAGATITSAVLSVYVSQDASVADFNVVIQNGQPTYPHDPLVTDDYYYLRYSGDGGSRNTNTIGGVGYWNITLNSDGKSWIQIGGTTKLCLRSSKDIAGTTPSGAYSEAITIRSLEYGANYAAKLYITYFEGEPPEPEDIYPLTVTITNPETTTYETGTIPVELSAETNGTNPMITYNVWRHVSSNWVYANPIPYTEYTEMTDFVNGTYSFYAYAINEEGFQNSNTQVFYVAYWEEGPPPPPPPLPLEVFIWSPDETTYYNTQNIPIMLSYTTTGTNVVVTYRIWDNIGGKWMWSTPTLYTTPVYLTIGNGDYLFYAYATNAQGDTDQKTRYFKVQYTEGPIYPIDVVISNPQPTTYSYDQLQIPLELTAYTNGTNPKITYNIFLHSTGKWLLDNPAPYTQPCYIIGLMNGTHTLHAYATNKEGFTAHRTVTFDVRLPLLVLTITSPVAMRYNTGTTIQVILSVTTEGTNPIITYNVWSLTTKSYVYEDDIIYPDGGTSLIGLPNDNYVFYAHVTIEEGGIISTKTVDFSVGPAPAPPPVPLDTETTQLVISLAVCLGMGSVGFGMTRGKDPTPALFMIILGLAITWMVGWLPMWIFIFSIVALALLLAYKFSRTIRGD